MSYPAGNINAEPDGYAIQRTTNNGTTWGTQVSGSGTINGLDKIMVAADDVPTSPFANNFYCTWSNFNVSNGRIEFNRSINGGTTFSTPIALNANWGQGANVQTGPSGEVYVCWADYTNNTFPEKGLGFTRSTDGGQNFTNAAVGFSYAGIRSSAAADPNFNNTRVNSFPSMAVDKSNGSHRGRIYVSYAAKENGNGKSVIEVRFSDNQGITWSSPSVVSIPNGRQNWFPWMAVDDTNGNIYITYYCLDEATGFNTNTYVAVSNDAGQSFVNQRVSDVNHVTAPIPEFAGGYIGDYIGITAFGGVAYASWSDNRTGQWQIYVSRVSNNEIVGDNIICNTSNSYSVTNLPIGSTVAWQAAPSGIASLSASGNQVFLSKLTDGIITLTATISNACGSQPITITKQNIIVGTPIPKGINGPNHNLCYNGRSSEIGTFYVANPSSGLSYSWQIDGQGVGSGNSIRVNAFTWGIGAHQIQVRSYTTDCGYSSWYTSSFYVVNCSGGAITFSTSPNPTPGDVQVETTETDKTIVIKEIQVTDKFGNIKKKIKVDPAVTKLKINIADLPIDIYIIRIYDGKTWVSKKVVKI